jgi:hypothetical protein
VLEEPFADLDLAGAAAGGVSENMHSIDVVPPPPPSHVCIGIHHACESAPMLLECLLSMTLLRGGAAARVAEWSGHKWVGPGIIRQPHHRHSFQPSSPE